MWPTRRKEKERISLAMRNHSMNVRAMPGIADDLARDTLAHQMISSLRRLDYTKHQLSRQIDPARADPSHEFFDPERAAILSFRNGDLDEAVWLIFLATHFGKHKQSGWRRVADVYSGLGEGNWTWRKISNNPKAFELWLRNHKTEISGAFGNHRKYETLDPDSDSSTALVFESYVDWVGPSGSHEARFSELVREGGNDPNSIFDAFYRSFNVTRFGRLGRFDFLALIGRMGFAPISPGSTYIANATGPKRGARLLFGGNAETMIPPKTLEVWLQELDQTLGVGMQVLEDSVCNWQKSPTAFIHFKG